MSAATAYGTIVEAKLRALHKQLRHATQYSQGLNGFFGEAVRRPPPPTIRLRSKKRKGKHRVYLLWIDEVFQGEFPSDKARRAYLDATLLMKENLHEPEADR